MSNQETLLRREYRPTISKYLPKISFPIWLRDKFKKESSELPPILSQCVVVINLQFWYIIDTKSRTFHKQTWRNVWLSKSRPNCLIKSGYIFVLTTFPRSGAFAGMSNYRHKTAIEIHRQAFVFGRFLAHHIRACILLSFDRNKAELSFIKLAVTMVFITTSSFRPLRN